MELPRRTTIQGVASEVLTAEPSPDISYLLQSDAAEEDAVGSHNWQDSSWIFPKAMHFMEVPEYRPAVLAGLLVSIASKTDSTVNRSIFTGVSALLTSLFVSNVTLALVL